jgi:Holliday junction resolvasome RuvABC endonuclease subunit
MSIGYDYSMGSPSAYDSNNRIAYCLSKKPEQVLAVWKAASPDVTIVCFKDPGNKGVHRYLAIAEMFARAASPNDVVAIEGYAFGAKGRVFQIGENTGILMAKLLGKLENPDLLRPSPAQVKQLATGSGRAEKEEMLTAFSKAVGGEPLPLESPYTDIADAYWTALWADKNIGYNQLQIEAKKTKKAGVNRPLGLRSKHKK